jgi:hypothetical protein
VYITATFSGVVLFFVSLTYDCGGRLVVAVLDASFASCISACISNGQLGFSRGDWVSDYV